MKYLPGVVIVNLLLITCNCVKAQNINSTSLITGYFAVNNSGRPHFAHKSVANQNLEMKDDPDPVYPGNRTEKDSIGKPIILWPAGAPGEQGNIGEEKNNTKPEDGKTGGRDVVRLTNVTNPTITIYYPQKKNDNHTAVIVCPGGGYSILAMDLEGTEVCEWLNSIGITAVLLKHRVPRRQGLPMYQAPLQDAQRAMGMVRFNATKWGIDPGRIGIMGFSAGGHLSAALSNNFSKRTYPGIDAADETNCRPDFAILIYPAYLTDEKNGSILASSVPVTDKTPPTFLMQTEDDPINVENSLYYYLALKKAKVPAEMHLYSSGGHGYGFRSATGGTSGYPRLIEKWIVDNKF